VAIATHKTERRSPRCDHRGMTLIEAAVSVLIVGVMLVAALTTLAGAAKARFIQQRPSVYQALARQLLAEVMQAAYEDPESSDGFGPEPDEDTTTRADFDDVDDYHGWSADEAQAKDGTPLTGCPPCSRFVKVGLANPSEFGFGVSVGHDDIGLKEIHVYVTDETGNGYVVRGLRCRYSENFGPSAEQANVISWAGIELQTGSGAVQKVHTAVNLVNLPQDIQGG